MAEDWAKDANHLEHLKEFCQAPEVLLMKPGAQVLLIQNLDVPRGLCNGTAGIIRGLADNKPVVEFPSAGVTVVIEKNEWTIKDGDTSLASRKQFPLILGWAITFHKSQGMTLDSADIGMEDLFASGQCYTGVSRVRSLEGLTIDKIPSDESTRADRKVVEFYRFLELMSIFV